MKLRLALVGMVLLAAMGCGGSGDRMTNATPPPDPMPTPDSPQNALRALEWAWNHHDEEALRGLLTLDFQFVFAALDTSGNAYRDRPFTRDDELISARHLYAGGHPTEPPVVSIHLQLDENFNVFPDPRPGRTPIVHKNIRTTVSLELTRADGSMIAIDGMANFFLVRGDSAQVPPDVPGGADATRWWIQRWEDETYAPGASPLGAATPTPATAASWGSVKSRYR